MHNMGCYGLMPIPTEKKGNREKMSSNTHKRAVRAQKSIYIKDRIG
jgi:hypothetical protein